MGEPEKKSETSHFIQKLKEKQENQRALVQAIDDLAIEQKRVRNSRIKAVFVFISFIGFCWYSFEAIKPYISSLWTETWTAAKGEASPDISVAPPPTREPRTKPAKLGEDAALPTVAQEKATESFVTPLPTIQDDDTFYATFRTPPPEAAERLAMEYLGIQMQVAAPTVESYNSVNQLSPEVMELERLVQLDKRAR
jgi:hypothetical protein